MPAITISAAFGAGGSVIAPRLAHRLGFTLLDRAISRRIAEQLNVTPEEAESGEKKRSRAERFFQSLAPLSGGVIGLDAETATQTLSANPDSEFRRRADSIMREALPGGVVVLGRGGGAALRDEPGVLRVRLFGPAEARAAQAARIEEISIEESRAQLPGVDSARAHYVRRLYGCEIDDPALYHLQLDTTAIGWDECVDTIAAAFSGLRATP